MTLDERIEFLMQSIESHDRQIGELTGQIAEVAGKISEVSGQIAELTKSMNKLVAVTNDDANSIRSLARIVEAYDKRISHLEESQ